MSNTTPAKKTQEAVDRVAEDIVTATEQLLDTAPGALSQAAQRVEQIARAGIDKARDASHSVAQGADKACTRTADYVRHEPGKALLMAAAAGAAATLLVSWATRTRHTQRNTTQGAA